MPDKEAAQRNELGIDAGVPVRYRRMRLSCGGPVLSEADNWYLPRLLTPDVALYEIPGRGFRVGSSG
jgi:hypothetical protein